LDNPVGTLYANYVLPLENTITYQDGSGNTLKKITKTWVDQYLMASQTTTLNDGTSAQVKYTYNDGSAQIASEVQTDYGPGAPGGALRVIKYNYQPEILDRPCQVLTYDGSGSTKYAETDYYFDGGTTLCAQSSSNSTSAVPGLANHDETSYGSTSNIPRGNVTKVVQLDLETGAGSTTGYTYDESGQVTSMTDPNGHTTTYSHLDSYVSGEGTPSRQSDAYLTRIVRPNTGPSNSIGHVQNFTYRYKDGQLATSSDENSNTTAYFYNDSLLRPTEADYPDGGKITTAYNDSGPTPSQTTTKLLSSASSLVETTMMDGAGHPIETELTSDPTGTVYTMTAYDGLGRPWSVSNPYRSTQDTTYGFTTYSYDGAGRTVQIANPDASKVTTAYSAPSTTVTDEAGCARTLSVDGIGRLGVVIEDPSSTTSCNGISSHFAYETRYTYDPLDDLTGVVQGAETRTFVYDSLKRLTSATNPESGTVSYTYDSAGNLQTRTDNRKITTTYVYDALNRNTAKTYSDGTPSVSYSYDPEVTNGLGRLGSEANSSAVTNFTGYDAMGRVTASSQEVGGSVYSFAYGYNLAGSMTSETYPSGRVLTIGFDSANREVSVTGTYNQVQKNYISSATYAPQGVPTAYAYGNGSTPGTTYNNRLQPTQIYSTTSNGFLYYLWLNWASTNNNGNLLQLDEEEAMTAVPYGSLTTYGQNFAYDTVNRLKTATDSGGWSRSFSYDQYGNGWVTGWSGMGLNLTTPTGYLYNAQNQFISSPYDASGNMLALLPGNAMQFSYDAENRQTAESYSNGMSATYLYDGDGKRMEKILASGAANVYVYDAFGTLAAECDKNAPAPQCSTCYLNYDHLGSLRLVTDQSASIIARHTYLPFGEEVPGGTAGRSSQFDASDDISQKFTGKERDTETSLDYFEARYYGAGMERFMSVDEGPFIWRDPQTLNRYAYSRNNPLAFVDPTGKYFVVASQDRKFYQKALTDLYRRPGGRELVNLLAN
jgi:RHS repeat-associated protein